MGALDLDVARGVAAEVGEVGEDVGGEVQASMEEGRLLDAREGGDVGGRRGTVELVDIEFFGLVPLRVALGAGSVQREALRVGKQVVGVLGGGDDVPAVEVVLVDGEGEVDGE